MKLLSLEIENLNSLFGKHVIDFTDSAFSSSNLFVITGATGSGKTTILDAICLAIFGKTPRLGKISKNKNDILSKGAKHCSANIEFKILNRHMRASFYQAYQKDGKNLQQQRRSITDLVSGKTIDKNIEEFLQSNFGLTFDIFTKSVMLAQGAFDEFLKATPKDRSPILEQITSSEIYSQISKFIYYQHKSQNEKFKLLKNQIEEAGEPDILHLNEQKELLNFCEKNMQAYNEKLKVLDEILPIKERIISHKDEKLAMENSILRLKQDQQTVEQSLTEQQLVYDGVKKTLVERQNTYNKAKEIWTKKITTEKLKAKVEQQLADKNSQVITIVDSLAKQEADVKELNNELIKNKNELVNIEGYQQKYAKHKMVFDNYDSIISLLNNIIDLNKEINAQDIDDIEKLALTDIEEQNYGDDIHKLDDKIRSIIKKKENEQKISTMQEEIKKLNQDLSDFQEQQKKYTLFEIHESYKHYLQHGEPCPLCRQMYNTENTELVAANHMEAQELEYINKQLAATLDNIAERNAEVRILQKNNQDIATDNVDMAKLEQQRAVLIEKKQQYESSRDYLFGAKKIFNNFEQLKSLLAHIMDISNKLAQMPKLLAQITDIKNTWQQQQQAMESISKDITTIISSIDKENKRSEELIASCYNIEKELITLTEENETLQRELQKIIFEHEDLLKEDINNLQKQVESLEGNANELASKLDKIKKQQVTISTNINTSSTRILEINDKLLLDSNKEVELLSLDSSKEFSGKSIIDLKEINMELKAKKDKEIEQQAVLKTKIEHLEKEQAKYLQLQERYEQQKLIEQRWSNLSKLIGSSDGQKYRNYAQAITFDLVIFYANEKLRLMSSRYLLEPKMQGGKFDSTLDINIIDSFQGNIARTIDNLSGGERFLVSLALALGLSQLSAQNFQIDTLFLDEGFGTLDEKTLEEALNMLTSLQNEGKLVGIISHIKALSEQIPVQINLLDNGNGRSNLSGAGVISKLA